MKERKEIQRESRITEARKAMIIRISTRRSKKASDLFVGHIDDR